ncbi:uncharacterized protein LOC129803608 isoform X1 [Phlebotomus papatasi]|uniref:uncharacterized protein LOC129803608 isoform X1 n=1 Tax=Phlebotomus papatasi TaxID=29031 RepID=UPI002483EB9F|nr:uncharacterized protein LOC129803608 isoform X1 [Phlebotomus papatasi]
MGCLFCEKTQENPAIGEGSNSFISLLKQLWKHHSDLKADFERVSLEKEALKNEIDILQAAEKCRMKFGPSQPSQPKVSRKESSSSILQTQPIFSEDEDRTAEGSDWDDAFLVGTDEAFGKENSPRRKSKSKKQESRLPLSPQKDNIFVDNLPVRPKSKVSPVRWYSSGKALNETMTSKNISALEKPTVPSKLLDMIKPSRSKIPDSSPNSEKKLKLRQTTLNFSRVDRDETFCEELVNATPEKVTQPKLWSRGNQLGDTPLDRKTSLQDDITQIHPEDTIFIDDSQEKFLSPPKVPQKVDKPEKIKSPDIGRPCLTPDGFWDLDFPPTAKTQPASPSDRLCKRPRKKS